MRPRAAAGGGELLRRLLERLAAAADQHQVGALGREPVGDRAADPLAGAGDDDVPSLEAARHEFSFPLLDGARDDAADEMALEDQVRADHGQRRDQQPGHQRRVVGGEAAL